ncbi:MAG: hypothetical protein NTW19_01020 [Planctomycetota bacterium]|nr:hypothetical protein [Planctomycetota bacterium]
MNRQTLGALVALNLVLVLALAIVGFTPQPAAAQNFVRPQYMMIAGEVPGRVEATIYVIELASSRVAAIIFRSSDNRFEVLAQPQPMMPDMEAVPR